MNVLFHRYITKYVSISPLSTVCLVFNVQLTEFIIVFPSNKWAGVVCVVRQTASATFAFHKVVWQHYSGEVAS